MRSARRPRPGAALRISAFKGLELDGAFTASFERYGALIASQGALATLAGLGTE